MKSVVSTTGTGHFVIGVDFGTTYTSVAFAHSSNRDDVKLVQTWPHGSSTGDSADQVPTELLYTETTTPTNREFQWGWSIPAPSKETPAPLRWFKLLLQNNPQPPTPATPLISTKPSRAGNSASANPASQTSIKLRALGIEPVTVVQDFLTSIRLTARESIERTYDKQFVLASKFQYIVTIPAIWSDAAKAGMVQACTAAGYGAHRTDFHLVSEPEAAAAHTLKVVQPHDLKEDDTFIICDAGGGTVDLIAYRIRSLEPLVIDEVVSGSGDLCGAVYLDDAFRAYVEERLEGVRTMSVKARAAMERSWQEQVKFKFTTEEKSNDLLYEINVPGMPDDKELDVLENFHTMARESVQQIFDPVVERVIKLVNQQVMAVQATKHKVAAILLVGGFGSSRYLFERLQSTRYGAKKDTTIPVIQPINAKTAIARGALLRGLDGSSVTDQRARRFYGIQADALASEVKTGFSRAYTDCVDGSERIPGCLFWYVKKNDLFSRKHSYAMSFVTNVSLYTPNFVFEDDILAFDHDRAPRLRWAAGGKDVYRVCTLRGDLTVIPRDSLPIVVGDDGLQYYNIEYTIKMTMEDDVLRFELLYAGVSYGRVEPKFE